MANDVHKLIFAYSSGGEFQENVLHFQGPASSSATPEADSQALIAGFQSAIYPEFVAAMGDDTVLLGLKAQRVNNTGGPSVIAPATAGSHGTAGTDTIDSRIAAVLTNDYYNAPGAKPAWRVGRIFVGGVPDSFRTENQWSSDAIAAYLAIATALNSGFSGGSLAWTSCVWSPKYDTAFPGDNWELTLKLGSLARREVPTL